MSGVRSCVLKFLKRFWLTSLLTIKVDFQCLDPRIQKTYISVQTADLAMRTQGIRDTDLSDKRFSAQRLKVTPNVRLVSWVLHVQKSRSSECLQDWRDRALRCRTWDMRDTRQQKGTVLQKFVRSLSWNQQQLPAARALGAPPETAEKATGIWMESWRLRVQTVYMNFRIQWKL